MEYTVIVNGRSYDLPKKTMKIVEEMDRVSKIDKVKGMGIRDKFKALFDYISSLVGKENAKEILGSDNLDEVDLCEVTITFRKIIDAYDKPLTDYTNDQTYRMLSDIPFDKLSALLEASKTMNK